MMICIHAKIVRKKGPESSNKIATYLAMTPLMSGDFGSPGLVSGIFVCPGSTRLSWCTCGKAQDTSGSKPFHGPEGQGYGYFWATYGQGVRLVLLP
jgi:hypothetical protein